jgi:hypothetical protein
VPFIAPLSWSSSISIMAERTRDTAPGLLAVRRFQLANPLQPNSQAATLPSRKAMSIRPRKSMSPAPARATAPPVSLKVRARTAGLPRAKSCDTHQTAATAAMP